MVEVDSTAQSAKPRRRWERRLAVIALAIVFLILVVNLLGTILTHKTAPGFLLAQWRDPVIRPFGYQPAAFYRADRIKHAQFWLDQANRLARDDRASGEALMGCAWLLHNLSGQNTTPDMQHELWNTSLELAALATHREPQNVDWWQLRAWLAGVDRYGALVDDWMKVLREAAKHDPDNALYDYIAARNIGWSSVRMAHVTGNKKPFIVEREKFDEARKLVEHGLVKQVMDCPNNQVSLILDFLEQSSQPRFLIADVYFHGGINCDSFTPLRFVYELRQRQLAGVQSAEGNVKAHRQTLRMAKQCEDAGAVDPWIARMKAEALSGLQDASLESAPNGLDDEENQLERVYEAAKAEETLAWKLLDYGLSPPGGGPYKALIPIILWEMTVRAIELLIVGALVLGLASWILRSRSQITRFGASRHVLAWAIGMSLSILVFAAVPAQLLPDSVTTIIWAVAVYIPVGVLLCLPLWVLRRQRGRRSGVMFAASLAMLAAVYGLVKWLHLDLRSVAISAGSLSRDPDLLDSILIDRFGFQWALAQWDVRQGLITGIAISVTLLATWYIWPATRQSQQGFRRLWFRKPFAGWAGLFSTLARSMTGAAVCLLVIYLALAPSAVREVDFANNLMRSMRRMEPNPALNEAIAKARGNPAELDRLLKQVEQGQFQVGTQLQPPR